MTQPAPNPPTTDAPAQPGKAMRVARLVIAISLIVACGVFSVFAIRDIGRMLDQGYAAPDAQTGNNNLMSSDDPPPSGGSLLDMARLDPSRYIPITGRDNPHPGEIEPFYNAAAFMQPPYRQPKTAGEVWEFCHYRVIDASLTPRQAFEHYDAQAKQRGLKLLYNTPSDTEGRGGLKAAWSDGKDRLELRAWPTPGVAPAAPPLRPRTPLDWVVKYSYPDQKK